MNHDFCINLNFVGPLLNTELNPLEFLKNKSDQYKSKDSENLRHTKSTHFLLDIQDDLSDEVKDFFEKNNQFIVIAEVFRRPNKEISTIHSDDKDLGDYSKMNWIFGGTDSLMNWYKIKEDIDLPKIYKTSIKSYSLLYRMDQVHLLYSEAFRGPSIVQVGVPHNIINLKDERFCVSVVFKDKTLGRRPGMAEAKEIFKDYIIQ